MGRSPKKRVSEDQVDRKARLNQNPHQVTANTRLGLIGVIGIEAAVGFNARKRRANVTKSSTP